MKRYFVKKDFDVVTNNDEAKVFQVIAMLDQDRNDLSGKVAGLFFKNDHELVNYLKSNLPLHQEERVEIIEDL